MSFISRSISGNNVPRVHNGRDGVAARGPHRHEPRGRARGRAAAHGRAPAAAVPHGYAALTRYGVLVRVQLLSKYEL